MAYIYSLADTWNASGTTFTGIGLNVTDTASAAGSLLMDLQVGGSSRFSVRKDGVILVNRFGAKIETPFDYGLSLNNFDLNGYWIGLLGNQGTFIGSSRALGWSSTNFQNGVDLILTRDAANTLAQRNGVNAQAFNLYNTYTDASNYERGFMRFVSNTLQVGTEAAGTGTGRSLSLVSGGATYFTLSNFNVNFSSNRRISLNTGGWIDVLENGSAVAAPASDTARIYAEDNGSGKTRLMVQFFSGAAQQIAIEP